MMAVDTTLPRVTEILQGANLIDTTWFTPEGCERGQMVHLACQYLDENDLDESTVDPAILGYVAAYRRFRAESGDRQWDWIECPRQDPLGLYRGTSDRIFTARPAALWDIKTGSHQPWHAIQLAAYVNMLNDPYGYRRFGLYLKPNGRYSVREFTRSDYQRDLNVFLAALTLFNWRAHYGN